MKISKRSMFLTSAAFSSAFLFVIFQNATTSSAVFNEACYLKRYPDVVSGWTKKGLRAIDHWNKHGSKENRIPGCDVVVVPPPVVKPPVVTAPVVKPPVVTAPVVTTPAVSSSVFNEACYLKRYPDVVSGWTSKGLKAIDHYNNHGKNEKRIPGCDSTAPVVTTPPVVTPPVVAPPAAPIIPATLSLSGKGSLPIKVTVDNARFGGAVVGLTWNGKEFINIYDHGRQLQSAMQVDGFGECNNPTEAGSEHDARKQTSTSKVLASTKTDNTLSTKAKMAYWTFQKSTGACKKGIDTRLTNALSEHVLEKDIQIGYNNDEQIIKYSIKYTHPEKSVNESVVYEFLTGYLNSEFSRFYYVGLADQSLNEYMDADLTSLVDNGFPKGSFFGSAKNKKQFDPVIMATANGKHAMGVYTSKKAINDCKSAFHGYNIYKFNLGGSGANGNATNKWSLAVGGDPIKSSCIVNNTRSFVVYIAVGDVDEVHRKLLDLAKLNP